jgi:P-type Ca2+ transporter type 2C
MKPYLSTQDTLIAFFSTDPEYGLLSIDAEKRLKKYGMNRLSTHQKAPLYSVFLRQFQSPLIYILLIAATIIFFFGNPLDAFVISGILFFNAIVGTLQEGRAENMLEGLQHFLKAQALIIRDGKKMIISDELLVPGDILFVQEGEKVPADARLLEANDLLIDQSMLTGESKAILKSSNTLKKEVPVADRDNMIYRGTYVLSGAGKALVVTTGGLTEVGKIGHSVEEIETDMPLKTEVDRLSQWILYFIIIICLFLFIIGIIEGKELTNLLVMLTALFICVVPEGLPVVLTLALVTGAYRMAKENVLVKRLQAAEGLGRTDVIVLDKTGTLTRNEMIVSRIMVEDRVFEVTGQGYYREGNLLYNNKKYDLSEHDSMLKIFAQATALLNQAEIEFVPNLKTFKIIGDPTEAAMLVFAEKLGFDKEIASKTYKHILEIPFRTDRRYQAGFYRHDNKVIIFLLGAPEVIMEKVVKVSSKTKEVLQGLLGEGFRVIAGAVKEIDLPQLPVEMRQEQIQGFLKDNFSFLGLLAIEDTIRPEVPRIIDESRKAGLRIVMATGDHKDTALFVAKKVGIFKPGDQVIDGSEFQQLSDQELLKRVDVTTVFSRVTPENKLKIIQLYQKEKNIVAMTGDGVNDAPSLVAADIGIAMGIMGTEVAKQAADLILLDDSFSSIIKAIEQGRHIFNTLRRVVMYFFTTNMAEVLIVLFALLGDFSLPLLAVQILWLNLITDGFLNVALSMEPVQLGLLDNNIIKSNERLVDWHILAKMLYLSVPMAIGSLGVFLYYQSYNIQLARTMTLITMAMFQWMNSWNCRSEDQSLFKIGFFSNRWLLLATSFVFGLQLLILYAPIMQRIFRTVPLSFEQWVFIFALTAPLFIIEELRKMVFRYFHRKLIDFSYN